MITLAQMKKRSRMVGYHWFDKVTMEYWGTRIERVPNYMNVFVTSDLDYFKIDRKYTLAEAVSFSEIATKDLERLEAYV